MNILNGELRVRVESNCELQMVSDQLECMGYKWRNGEVKKCVMDIGYKSWPYIGVTVNCFNGILIIDAWDNSYKYMSAKQFFSDYPKPQNKNMQDFNVDTKGVMELSHIVEGWAKKAGFKWPLDIPNGRSATAVRIAPILCFKTGILKVMTNDTIAHPGSPIYDARTQMGEILELFFSPLEPPEIHGHPAKYTKNGTHIQFGCAKLFVGMLKSIDEYMSVAHNQEVRTIQSIALSSGKVLDCGQIKEIIEYINAVDAMN